MPLAARGSLWGTMLRLRRPNDPPYFQLIQTGTNALHLKRHEPGALDEVRRALGDGDDGLNWVSACNVWEDASVTDAKALDPVDTQLDVDNASGGLLPDLAGTDWVVDMIRLSSLECLVSIRVIQMPARSPCER